MGYQSVVIPSTEDLDINDALADEMDQANVRRSMKQAKRREIARDGLS